MKSLLTKIPGNFTFLSDQFRRKALVLVSIIFLGMANLAIGQQLNSPEYLEKEDIDLSKSLVNYHPEYAPLQLRQQNTPHSPSGLSLSPNLTPGAIHRQGGGTTLLFSFTGVPDTFIVPCGVSSISIEAYGAQGGDSPALTAYGGLGGYVSGDHAVTPGDTLFLYVGEMGLNSSNTNAGVPGSFNGGGSGGASIGGASQPGGAAGGGASDIRLGGNSFADRIIVAAGGGGAGGGTQNNPVNGGAGGGFLGGDGLSYSSGLTFEAWGGTQSVGGRRGQYVYAGQILGTDGSFGIGGDANGGGYSGGGGGGGGWYGGGGGSTHFESGGGGGSSYSGALTNDTTIAGIRSGHGQIMITFTEIPIIADFVGLSVQKCEGENPDTLLGSPVGGIFTGNGITGNVFDPLVAGPGMHTIIYTYDSMGCYDADTQSVEVLSPMPVFLGPDDSLCVGDTLILDAGAGFVAYNWSDMSNQQTLIVTNTGTFWVEVQDSNGCLARDTMIVDTCILLSNFQGITPSSSLQVYPNPATHQLYIQPASELKGQVEISVFDASGRKLETQTLNGLREVFVLNLENYSKGLYFIRLVSKSINVTEKVLLK